MLFFLLHSFVTENTINKVIEMKFHHIDYL